MASEEIFSSGQTCWLQLARNYLLKSITWNHKVSDCRFSHCRQCCFHSNELELPSSRYSASNLFLNDNRSTCNDSDCLLSVNENAVPCKHFMFSASASGLLLDNIRVTCNHSDCLLSNENAVAFKLSFFQAVCQWLILDNNRNTCHHSVCSQPMNAIAFKPEHSYAPSCLSVIAWFASR